MGKFFTSLRVKESNQKGYDYQAGFIIASYSLLTEEDLKNKLVAVLSFTSSNKVHNVVGTISKVLKSYVPKTFFFSKRD